MSVGTKASLTPEHTILLKLRVCGHLTAITSIVWVLGQHVTCEELTWKLLRYTCNFPFSMLFPNIPFYDHSRWPKSTVHWKIESCVPHQGCVLLPPLKPPWDLRGQSDKLPNPSPYLPAAISDLCWGCIRAGAAKGNGVGTCIRRGTTACRSSADLNGKTWLWHHTRREGEHRCHHQACRGRAWCLSCSCLLTRKRRCYCLPGGTLTGARSEKALAFASALWNRHQGRQ